jgi:hypothetical protein
MPGTTDAGFSGDSNGRHRNALGMSGQPLLEVLEARVQLPCPAGSDLASTPALNGSRVAGSGP